MWFKVKRTDLFVSKPVNWPLRRLSHGGHAEDNAQQPAPSHPLLSPPRLITSDLPHTPLLSLLSPLWCLLHTPLFRSTRGLARGKRTKITQSEFQNKSDIWRCCDMPRAQQLALVTGALWLATANAAGIRAHGDVSVAPPAARRLQSTVRTRQGPASCSCNQLLSRVRWWWYYCCWIRCVFFFRPFS